MKGLIEISHRKFVETIVIGHAQEAEMLTPGMAVTWREEGFEYFGQVVSIPTSGASTDAEGRKQLASRTEPMVIVRRAVEIDGVLTVTDSQTAVPAVKVAIIELKFAAKEERVRGGEAFLPFEPDGKKSYRTVQDADENIEDYLDVEIEGYLSTVQAVTPRDREGDYVLPGAFKDTISGFMENPVMLRDHKNSTQDVVGQFTSLREDTRGLNVKGLLSNAPGLTDLRYKVVERCIRAFSMGGLWSYLDDGYGISRAYLFEGSVVAIPMNPQAIFRTRALNNLDTKRLQHTLSGKTAARE